MQRVSGVVKHYEWGDQTFIPDLLGLEPDGKPWAEWWLGTHPSGPTTFLDGGLLNDVTGPLPFLLKVLAAAEPLSLQTHPTPEQARDGFARGVYPDGQAKPELLCALTPFEALCGIRPEERTLAILSELGVADSDLARVLAADGAGAALVGLYRNAIDPSPAVTACQSSARPEADWVRQLDVKYPGDPSVAATLLLNYVVLAPGEALRLDAGNLHAYLRGAGIELMGASDNVIRGGLTVKPVDVDELLHVVDLTPLAEPVLPIGTRYELPDTGVALVKLEAGEQHQSTGHELTIDLRGVSWYLAPGDQLETTSTMFVVVPSPA